MAHRWRKTLGLAGILGIAATGVVVARRERERRSYTPEEVRDRLQQRYADLDEEERRQAIEAWRQRRERLGTTESGQTPAP